MSKGNMNNSIQKNSPNPTLPMTAVMSSVPQGLAIQHDVRLRTAQAQLMSQYQMALMLPRSWEGIRPKLLLACENPDFAKEAYYRKPAGSETIEGLSVRFAEFALPLMRNVSIDVQMEDEDDLAVRYRITMVDIESNNPLSETFSVAKTVERKFVREGDTVLSQRSNSKGEPVYLIPATEDQVFTKSRAQISKVRRTLILSLIPAEIRAECLARCREVALATDAKDPAAAAKAIVMAFVGVGIEVSDLKEYLGKSPANATPAEVESLRLTFALIRDGEITWTDVMTAKREREEAQGSKAAFVAQKEKERTAARGGGRKPAAQARAAATADDKTTGGNRRGRGSRGGQNATGSTPAGEGAGGGAASTEPAKTEAPRQRASRHEEEEDDGRAGDDADTSPASSS